MPRLPKPKTAKSRLTAGYLRRLNLAAAALYAAQALLILFLDTAKTIEPVTIGFLARDRAGEAIGQSAGAQAYHVLFDLNLAYPAAAILIMGAGYHLLAATRYRGDYETGLKKSVNKLRWIYAGLSLGLLAVIVAMLSGIHELALLVSIFTLMEAVSLSGYTIEKNAAEKNINRITFFAGIKTIAVVGFVFLLYIVGALIYGEGIPGFLYFIYLSNLLLFGSLVINLYLQAKKMGHWESYLFSEKFFILASFIGLSAIAWQIFASALR